MLSSGFAQCATGDGRHDYDLFALASGGTADHGTATT
jgi:hypothetical protein